MWQQSTYVSMPPPTHHSTPTTVASERRPVGEQHLYNTQLVRSQGDQHNSASVPVSRISMHPGLGENGSSVGQYAQPTAVVSNTYGLNGMQSSYQNYLPNYWFPGANNAPLQILPQQENIASVARPALHLGGNTSQSGSQGIQINQNPVLSSQFVPGGPQRASLHGVGSNVPMLQEPNISGFPSAPLDYAPNTQQLAARHVVSRELPIFDGNPAEWPMFWSSYTTSTQMCGYTGAENLLRLQRCLKGEARKAVNSFLLHPANVDDIMSTLRTLYGRPEAIINTLLNDVRSTPTPKPEKLETLVNFGLVVRNLCAHLVSAGQEMHLANPILLQELVDKLPANVKLGWAMHKQSVAVADLRTFAEYMNVIINAASSVSSGITEVTKAERQKGKAFVNSVRLENNSKSDQRTEKSSSSGKEFVESKASTAPKVRPCAVCQVHGHKPKDCSVFKTKSLGERWKAVQEAHLCKRCLYPHGKWPCKAPVCGSDGCQDNHQKFLHPGKPQAEGQPRKFCTSFDFWCSYCSSASASENSVSDLASLPSR